MPGLVETEATNRQCARPAAGPGYPMSGQQGYGVQTLHAGLRRSLGHSQKIVDLEISPVPAEHTSAGDKE
jgi:hypothetical protein